MNISGILIGIASFLITGIFHPIVIKCEYYFTKKVWPSFFISGVIFILISLFISNIIISILLGVIGFSCFWSIGELVKQEKRVENGWFPKNPNRKL